MFYRRWNLANITALWVARKRRAGPEKCFDGVESEGTPRISGYGMERAVILVSRLATFPEKSGCLLGIGNPNVLAVDVDHNNESIEMSE
jgi:hypothetical protein